MHANEQQRLKYLEGVSIQLYHRLKRDDLWAAVAALADHLLAHDTLESEEIEEIVSHWLR